MLAKFHVGKTSRGEMSLGQLFCWPLVWAKKLALFKHLFGERLDIPSGWGA
jgi:hypothetical protein